MGELCDVLCGTGRLCRAALRAGEMTCMLPVFREDRRDDSKEKETHMSDTSATRGLTEDELALVVGGNRISLVPNPRQPKFGPPASIAQGEVNSNQTDNNLP